MTKDKLCKTLDDIENLLIKLEVNKEVDYKKILKVTRESHKAVLDYIKLKDKIERD